VDILDKRRLTARDEKAKAALDAPFGEGQLNEPVVDLINANDLTRANAELRRMSRRLFPLTNTFHILAYNCGVRSWNNIILRIRKFPNQGMERWAELWFQ
jgi:hypothetical protein